MAKIADSKPKTSSGGYDRLFGDNTLGKVLQRVQSAVIRNGNELEGLLLEQASEKGKIIPNGNLDAFVLACNSASVPQGTFLATKKMVKNSKYAVPGNEPDFVVFQLEENLRRCNIVEMKDGDDFDTKKSKGEHESLQAFTNTFARHVPFSCLPYICAFNQLDKSRIVSGFKGHFAMNEVMTGKEFCDILGISYAAIVKMRQVEAKANIEDFAAMLYEAEAFRTAFIKVAQSSQSNTQA